MPKEARKDLKRKAHETAENEKNPFDICSDSINTFIKQHSKELNIKNAQLIHLTEQCEQIRFIDTCKKSTFDELKKNLISKTNALDEMTSKYEKLRFDFQTLHTNLVAQNKKYVELEVSYSERHRSLTQQLQCANEQMCSVNMLLSAKEAECAAYLKDIRKQLEEANSENVQLQKQISDLQDNKMSMENLLEANKKEIELEKQNLINKSEEELLRKQKKITKKNKRIVALLKIVKTLESEKKELQKSLEMEGHKIRDLQKVLNRPISCASPIQEKNKIEHPPTKQVEPVMPLHESSSLSSRAPTPEMELEADIKPEPHKNIPSRSYGYKRPFQQNNCIPNEVTNKIVPEIQTQDVAHVSLSVCEMNIQKNKQQLDEWNQAQAENRPPRSQSNLSLKKDALPSNDDSEDIILPYRPKQTFYGKINGEIKSTFKGIKRFKK